MPIYEYVCQECQRPSEILVPSHTSRPSCPHCGSRKLQRRLSTFAAHGSSAGRSSASSGGSCPTGTCPLS